MFLMMMVIWIITLNTHLGAEVDNLYVGVYRGQGSNRVRLFIQSLLAYYLGTKAENKTIDSCNNELKQPVNPVSYLFLVTIFVF